ncbi:hypothetical protein [Kribbella sp. NBC_00359]|uniref:hypothetical protein n=1 Tax=Kribbella sp. NBC_00359 TaxID=2975966 RepID=UPI002E1D8D14
MAHSRQPHSHAHRNHAAHHDVQAPGTVGPGRPGATPSREPRHRVHDSSRRRLLAFRIIAALLGLLFLYAGLSNATAPWTAAPAMSGDLHPELHRWFTTVAGASDLIVAGCFLALARRPTRPLLFCS